MREVRLRQLLMLWSLISMTEPKIAALDAAKIWQLFNLGGTVLVSAEHDGKTDMMPASWASPLDYDKVLVVVDKSHYTRKLMDQSEYFALGVASAGILPELLSLGSVSKNADPEKLEKSGMALFTQPGFKIPLARGCSAWAIFKKLPETEELSKKYDLFLFSDEVYREFIYTGSPYISACHLEGIENNVVLIDSVSKRYSECGIRIGALITKNKEIRDAVMKFCQARLSPPLIGQIAAEASLDAGEDYLRDTYDEYVERRKCLIDGLNRIPGVYSPIPMGAFYTVAKLPVDDSDRFCAWCLSEFQYEGQTVFMAPASGFYTTPGSGRNEVRIAYVLKKEDLIRALFVLSKALEAYPGRTE